MPATIYSITNTVNGKAYIGFTTKNVRHRFGRHCRETNVKLLHAAIQKYGPEAFRIDVLAESPDPHHALGVLEPLYIDLYATLSPNGYNLHPGGKGGSTVTSETRMKLSRASRGRPNTPEAREKIRQSKIGKPRPRHVLEKLWASKPMYQYLITFPDGSQEHSQSLKRFSDAHGLNHSAMYRVMQGKHNQHKGFTVRRIS